VTFRRHPSEDARSARVGALAAVLPAQPPGRVGQR
jgi:hypothetical protein